MGYLREAYIFTRTIITLHPILCAQSRSGAGRCFLTASYNRYFVNHTKYLTLQLANKHDTPKTKAGSNVFMTRKINPRLAQFSRKLSAAAV
jgi:hypothetical protein